MESEKMLNLLNLGPLLPNCKISDQYEEQKFTGVEPNVKPDKALLISLVENAERTPSNPAKEYK